MANTKKRTLQITIPACAESEPDSDIQDIFSRRYIRYKEGVRRYSVSIHTFQKMAQEAGAVLRIKGVSLVDTEVLEEYLDSFRD